jgi:hypothetical protein
MGSFQTWLRPKSPGRRQGSVFAVGRRVYVACSGAPSGDVTLTDAAGGDPLSHLVDGTEVEILAWRPRGSDGTRYCVRAIHNGLVGWLPVDNLRNTRAAVPVPAVAPSATGADSLPAVEPRDDTRRFGQRGGREPLP